MRKEEPALMTGERRSLLSEGQAWPGSPGGRCRVGTLENWRGPETTRRLRIKGKNKQTQKTSKNLHLGPPG